jgi:hypothetical protein
MGVLLASTNMPWRFRVALQMPKAPALMSRIVFCEPSNARSIASRSESQLLVLAWLLQPRGIGLRMSKLGR